MGKTRPYRHVIKILKDAGWEYNRTTGSHEIYKKGGISCPVKCTSKDIPSGTLTSIERVTGLKF